MTSSKTSSATAPAAPPVLPRGTRSAWGLLLGVAGAGVASGLAVAGLVLSGGVAPAAWATVAVALPVGWSYLAVGLYAWWRRPANPFGRLLVAVCFAWFAGGLAGAADPALHTAGLGVAGVYYAVVVHLLLAFPNGWVRGRAERGAVAVAYVTATVGQLMVLTVSDPPGPRNLLLIHRDPVVAKALEGAVALLGAAVAALVAGVLLARWRAATPGQRRALAPVLTVGAALAVLLAVSLALPVVAPAWHLVGAVGLIVALPLAGLPYAFLAGLVRARFFTASAVTDLLTRLMDPSTGAGPGGLRAALAGALGDPDLSIAYWVPDRDGYVDATGAAVSVPPPGRFATEVERDGHRVAALVHDPALAADPDLVRAAGAATALGLDNERLSAELRARVAELEDSRRQILEVSEAERRRLERDLHDGAQQRLVALRVTLSLARASTAQDPSASGRVFEAAGAELDAALTELRDLARGLHPAVLASRGLSAALTSLTARAPVPVELTVDLSDLDSPVTAGPTGRPWRGLSGEVEGRLSPAMEATVYYVVAEALTNLARHAKASRACVRVERRGNRLHVQVFDDGAGGADPSGSGLRGLGARVAAHDGVLTIDSPPGGGTVLRAELPLLAQPRLAADRGDSV